MKARPRNPCTDIASVIKPSKPPIHRARSVGRGAVHCGQLGEAYSKCRDRGAEPAAAGSFWCCYSRSAGGADRAPCTGELANGPSAGRRACWMNPPFGIPASI